MILSLQDKEQSVNPQQLRNKINTSANHAGFVGLLAVAAKKSEKGNLVLTFNDTRAKSFLAKNLHIVNTHVKVTEILDDSAWFKVAIHGIPTAFNNAEGP